MVPPLRRHWSEREPRIKPLVSFVERVPALLLLEQVGHDIAARRQPHLIALDLGNEALRDEMMVLLVTDAAVGADQLDAVVLDAVDGAEMHAVGADDFHMLANVFKAAHGVQLLLLSSPTLRSRHGMHAAPPNYACFGHVSSAAPACDAAWAALSRGHGRCPHHHARRRGHRARSPAFPDPCHDPPRGLSAARLAGSRAQARLRPRARTNPRQSDARGRSATASTTGRFGSMATGWN